jgi:hypothetical protein
MSGKMLTQHHPAYVHQMLLKTGFSEMQYLGTGVTDKLAGRLGRFEAWMPSERTIASVLGIIKLAPWIMCRTKASGEILKDYKCVDDLLICPSCHSIVRHGAKSYVCTSCNLSYPIENGIADFRVNA